MKRPSQSVPAEDLKRLESPRRLRIAIADDEPEMRAFMQKVCVHLGHDVVVVAENGEELVEQCLATQPHLVITDVIMPELDGLNALQQIRQHLDIQMIVVSAHDWPELRDRAQGLHVLAYLIKPIGMSDLKPIIEAAAEQAGFEQHGE